MSGFSTVLALAATPALGNFAGGVLADRTRVSPRTLSFALHAAAGIVFAVVGVELMPQALGAEPVWPVVLLFVAGGGFAVLIDRTARIHGWDPSDSRGRGDRRRGAPGGGRPRRIPVPGWWRCPVRRAR